MIKMNPLRRWSDSVLKQLDASWQLRDAFFPLYAVFKPCCLPHCMYVQCELFMGKKSFKDLPTYAQSLVRRIIGVERTRDSVAGVSFISNSRWNFVFEGEGGRKLCVRGGEATSKRHDEWSSVCVPLCLNFHVSLQFYNIESQKNPLRWGASGW